MASMRKDAPGNFQRPVGDANHSGQLGKGAKCGQPPVDRRGGESALAQVRPVRQREPVGASVPPREQPRAGDRSVGGRAEPGKVVEVSAVRLLGSLAAPVEEDGDDLTPIKLPHYWGPGGI